MGKVEIIFGRKINLMNLFTLERCLCPTYCYMNLSPKVVETKDDPRVPNKSHINEVSPTSSFTLLNVSTKSLMKNPNPPSRRLLIPSTILFSMWEIKPFLLVDELVEMKASSPS